MQTGLTQQDVQVSTVAFFVDILVALEGVFSLTTAQQSILIGVRHNNSPPCLSCLPDTPCRAQMFARAGGIEDASAISIISMVAPAPPPPYAPITYRRALLDHSGSSRRLLNGQPGLAVKLRCRVPDVATGDALIEAVPLDFMSDERQQEMVDLGIPVTDVGVPDYLGLDPWVNVTLAVTIPPETSGGGGMVAAQMGAALIAELNEAVRGEMLERALMRRGYSPCDSAMLVPPQLLLRVGRAPPPMPPQPLALAPPTPPAPLSPTALSTPPPRSPPPAAPPSPFHAPATLFGFPATTAYGIVAGAAAGGALCVAGVAALVVARRRRRARLEKYMKTRYQMPTLLEAGIVIGGATSKASSSDRYKPRSPARRAGSPKGATVQPLAAVPIAPLVSGGARTYTELARQLAADAAAREAAALARRDEEGSYDDLEAPSQRRRHRERSGSGERRERRRHRDGEPRRSASGGSSRRASDSARSWRDRLDEEDRGRPSAASSWSSEYGGPPPGPLGQRGGLAALFGLAPVEEEEPRNGRWAETR